MTSISGPQHSHIYRFYLIWLYFHIQEIIDIRLAARYAPAESLWISNENQSKQSPRGRMLRRLSGDSGEGLLFGKSLEGQELPGCAGLNLKPDATVESLKKELAPMMNGHHEVMTVPELAEYLQCNKSTIYRLIKRGQIPAFKVGADWRFKRNAIEEWLEQQHKRAPRLED